MKLTGKSLEQFEKWYLKDVTTYENYDQHIMSKFYQLHKSLQYGVLVDFFDSVGISIEILENTGNKWKGYINKEFKGVGYDSRPQARAKAIEKANEIYNNR